LYRSDEPGGVEHVVAYAPVYRSARDGGTTWALIGEEPWSEILSPWLRTSLLGPLILIPAVAVALVALWFAVQRVIHPLQRLNAQVAALGRGDFEEVNAPVGGIEEIQELQRALARMAAQVRAYQQSMRGYLGAVTSAQEDERKRLARELHDQTIQDLIALKQRVRRKAARDPAEVGPRLAELQGMLETTMDEVRRFSRALRPLYLEEAGLVAALEALARDAEQGGLQVSFQAEGDARLAPEVELALYRIVQEALHNAVRHAQASSIHIGLMVDDDVAVQVQDDGAGFVPPQRVSDLAEAGHFGLMGMHERAQLVGAHLVIRSRPGAGTTIEAHVPPRKPGD
jgi:signal transduction histidine kinase